MEEAASISGISRLNSADRFSNNRYVSLSLANNIYLLFVMDALSTLTEKSVGEKS